MELVNHVFDEASIGPLPKKDIIDMMEKFGLIAKFSGGHASSVATEAESTYFVPSQLKSSPKELCAIEPKKDDPSPLYLDFTVGFVPHGLFPQIVSRFIRWCSEQGFTDPPNLYHNGSRFFVGKRNTHDLILIAKKRFIKIVLRKRKPGTCIQPPDAAPEGDDTDGHMAGKVLNFFKQTLKSLAGEIACLRHMRYVFCVLCPLCSEREVECSKHRQVSCNQDDCAHLLPVQPGEELICSKDLDDESVKVPGLEKWFSQASAVVSIFCSFLCKLYL